MLASGRRGQGGLICISDEGSAEHTNVIQHNSPVSLIINLPMSLQRMASYELTSHLLGPA